MNILRSLWGKNGLELQVMTDGGRKFFVPAAVDKNDLPRMAKVVERWLTAEERLMPLQLEPTNFIRQHSKLELEKISNIRTVPELVQEYRRLKPDDLSVDLAFRAQYYRVV